MKNYNGSSSRGRSFFGFINRWGFLGLSGYLLWQNRFAIQRGLESIGINTPWMKSNLGEAVKSGAAKVSGKLDREERATAV